MYLWYLNLYVLWWTVFFILQLTQKLCKATWPLYGIHDGLRRMLSIRALRSWSGWFVIWKVVSKGSNRWPLGLLTCWSVNFIAYFDYLRYIWWATSWFRLWSWIWINIAVWKTEGLKSFRRLRPDWIHCMCIVHRDCYLQYSRRTCLLIRTKAFDFLSFLTRQ